jgi:hypothetical protein
VGIDSNLLQNLVVHIPSTHMHGLWCINVVKLAESLCAIIVRRLKMSWSATKFVSPVSAAPGGRLCGL